jgi:acid phosphatase type 7
VVGEHLRASLEPLLRRHLVDLVVSGHVHSYFRTCAVYDGDCVGGDGGGDSRHGAVHVVVGSAGRKLSRLERGQEEWVAAAEATWGYTRFDVRGAERMAVEFVESETGRVLDAFEVKATDERLRDACPRRRSGAAAGRGAGSRAAAAAAAAAS